jgi:hypothetical protein
MIRDYGNRKSMEFTYVIQEDPSHRRCRVRMFQWYEMSELGEFIHDNQDEAESTRQWKAFHKIK